MRIRLLACGGLVALVLALASPAWSQTYVGVTPPTLPPTNPVQQTTVTVPTPTASSGSLAVTGTDVVQLLAIAALVMSFGAFVVHVARERARTTD